LIKKILETLNKSLKEEEYLNFVLEFCNNENLTLDLMTKNMVMDYYCSTEKFVKAETFFN